MTGGSVFQCKDPDCELSEISFPVVGDGRWPVLVDFEKSVLTREGIHSGAGASLIRRDGERSGLLARVREGVGRALTPINTVASDQVRRLLSLVPGGAGGRANVLVVGGATIGNGVQCLYDADVDVIGFDIYGTKSVQVIADAHQIPFADCSVDAVVVQAVLEHVLEPSAVVAEIHRVLRPNGLVYADTPFGQQVHEGAYDFTRWTESGHRYLFRDFDEIDAGPIAGLGTQLLWSIDYFVRGMCRSRLAGVAARFLFFWLPKFDELAGRSFTVDGASSVYFLGRKSADRLTPNEAVRRYQGAQRWGL
jgi:SAM-dependent methyltransferase